MRVVGLMSGTSYDGIDVAVADLTYDRSGREIGLEPLGSTEYPHDDATRALLERSLPPANVEMGEVCRLDTMLGQAFAEAAACGIDELADGRADLVVSHGQTLFHWVEDGRARGSLQLGQPAWIAERTGLPVVSDLRNRDIAKGGQGAPLVPIFDVLLLPPGSRPRAALNLGGIANMTVIPPVGGGGEPLGYDLGPANALLDVAARWFLGLPYDPDGRHAAAGTVHEALLERLLAEPYYRRQAPKSTGKELFNSRYLVDVLAAYDDLGGGDVLATLTELTARVVVTECSRQNVADVLMSGGGVRNRRLVRRIEELSDPDLSIEPIDVIGIPAGAKEAYAFALLGYLTVHGASATIPSCTGASGPSIVGCLTPGDRPLQLPMSWPDAPARLRVVTREDCRHDRAGNGADRSG